MNFFIPSPSLGLPLEGAWLSYSETEPEKSRPHLPRMSCSPEPIDPANAMATLARFPMNQESSARLNHRGNQSKHTPRHRLPPRAHRAPAPYTRSFQPPSSPSTRSAAPAVLWACVAPQHEHGLAALLVELLEEKQRFFLEAEAALLVAVNDVQRVLAPVVVDVVAFEGLVGGVVSGVVLQVL